MSYRDRWKTCSAWRHVDEPVQYLGPDCPLCDALADKGEIQADLQQLQWDARILADALMSWYRTGAQPRHLPDAVDVAEAIERKHGGLTEAQRDELTPAPAGGVAR